AWKLAQSPQVPGNTNINHSILAQFCKDHHVGLVVVGLEVPLAFRVVVQSKLFKAFMERHGIPTLLLYFGFIRADFPALVVKASGLAAGKGTQLPTESSSFGSAGEEEVQTDHLFWFCSACASVTVDHKRLQDGDQRQNTGGMGAYLMNTTCLCWSLMLLSQKTVCCTSTVALEILNTMRGKLASSAPVWHQDSSAVTVVMAGFVPERSPDHRYSYSFQTEIIVRFKKIPQISENLQNLQEENSKNSLKVSLKNLFFKKKNPNLARKLL
uniref:Uncharacterized protein n=1 Tax=Acanthochromis polyacanthus TaxID=80966 RepID=A0A3Q1FXG8_9TELE